MVIFLYPGSVFTSDHFSKSIRRACRPILDPLATHARCQRCLSGLFIPKLPILSLLMTSLILHSQASGVDEGCFTILLLFDFSKTFDTVVHSFLNFEFVVSRTVRFIFSYLSGWSQAMVVGTGVF